MSSMEKKSSRYSQLVKAGKRTYFFDIKESKDGTRYMTISESKRIKGDEYERQSIMIFHEDIREFSSAFVSSLLQFNKSNNFESSYVENIRKSHKNAYNAWTKEEDEQLRNQFKQNNSIKKLSNIFGRKEGAIQSRIRKLNLKRQ